MNASLNGSPLITGASTGIGAIYADRLASRRHDLILVVHNRERLKSWAARITNDTGRSVQVIVADLSNKADLARVEQVQRTDASITVLINNAGIGATTSLLDSDIGKMVRMIDLNVTNLVRLTYAIEPAFVKRGRGTINNMASMVGIAPEVLNGVYRGTKAFVLAFSLSLHKELAESKIRIWAVPPGATATNIWDIAGTPLERLPSQIVMKADYLVNAAIAGFDQDELVIIPSLPDIGDWESYEAARQNMMPKLSIHSPAGRCSVTAA